LGPPRENSEKVEYYTTLVERIARKLSTTLHFSLPRYSHEGDPTHQKMNDSLTSQSSRSFFPLSIQQYALKLGVVECACDRVDLVHAAVVIRVLLSAHLELVFIVIEMHEVAAL